MPGGLFEGLLEAPRLASIGRRHERALHILPVRRFRVSGLGFRVCRVQGLGFRNLHIPVLSREP